MGHFDLESPWKTVRYTRLLNPILTHSINTWQHYPKLELRVGFGIHVNQFWTTWTTTRTTPMLQRDSSTLKIWSGMGHFDLESPWKTLRYTRLLNPILTHPINTWQNHPNLELRVGNGIPVNQFWTTWTTTQITLMLRRATSSLQIRSGTGRFELNIPQKGRKEPRRIDSSSLIR